MDDINVIGVVVFDYIMDKLKLNFDVYVVWDKCDNGLFVMVSMGIIK